MFLGLLKFIQNKYFFREKEAEISLILANFKKGKIHKKITKIFIFLFKIPPNRGPCLCRGPDVKASPSLRAYIYMLVRWPFHMDLNNIIKQKKTRTWYTQINACVQYFTVPYELYMTPIYFMYDINW